MSSKSKALAAIVPTLASLDSEEQAALAILERIKTGREQVKQKTAADVTAEITGLLPRVGKILGREINIGELLPMVAAIAKGNPLFAYSKAPGDRTQLSTEEKAALTADMKARAMALRAGQPAQPISQIAAKHQVNVNTAANYKPTQAEYLAFPGTEDVPSAYEKPAAA